MVATPFPARPEGDGPVCLNKSGDDDAKTRLLWDMTGEKAISMGR